MATATHLLLAALLAINCSAQETQIEIPGQTLVQVPAKKDDAPPLPVPAQLVATSAQKSHDGILLTALLQNEKVKKAIESQVVESSTKSIPQLIRADGASDAAAAATKVPAAASAAVKGDPSVYWGIFHTNMMCYYYFISLYIQFAAKAGVGVGGGGVTSLEKKKKTWSLKTDPRVGFLAPKFKQFERDMLKRIAHAESDEHPGVEHGMMMRQMERRADNQVVLLKWLDLAANFHIISGAYIGLSGAYKAVVASKDNASYMTLWQNTVKVMWQWSLIYADWLAIYNEYTEVQHLELVEKYTNNLFIAFSQLWAFNAYAGLYTSLQAPLSSPAAVWNLVSQISGAKAAMHLVHIGWYTAMAQQDTPSAEVYTAGIPFILYLFSVDMSWNSAIAYNAAGQPPFPGLGTAYPVIGAAGKGKKK